MWSKKDFSSRVGSSAQCWAIHHADVLPSFHGQQRKHPMHVRITEKQSWTVWWILEVRHHSQSGCAEQGHQHAHKMTCSATNPQIESVTRMQSKKAQFHQFTIRGCLKTLFCFLEPLLKPIAMICMSLSNMELFKPTAFL